MRLKTPFFVSIWDLERVGFRQMTGILYLYAIVLLGSGLQKDEG